MNTVEPVDGDRMTEAGATVVIAYSRFRECQDRRRAVAAALRQPDLPPTIEAFVVHVGAVSASLQPPNRKPC
jgi:hypothetical protein